MLGESCREEISGGSTAGANRAETVDRGGRWASPDLRHPKRHKELRIKRSVKPIRVKEDPAIRENGPQPMKNSSGTTRG